MQKAVMIGRPLAPMVESEREQMPDLEQQLSTEKKRSEEYLTRLKYLQADFENMRRRTDRQIGEENSYCTERLVIELLDVVDELELALKAAQPVNAASPLFEGVQMTLKKLRKILEHEGVSPMDCEGKVFDPSRHNAIATIERPDVAGCLVVEEVRKGYILKDKVIRPSIVKVAIKPSKSQMEENKIE